MSKQRKERIMPYGTTKQSLIDKIKHVRKERCSYVGDRCDCKLNGSTGCPELWAVGILLEGMSELEYEAIWDRVKNIRIEQRSSMSMMHRKCECGNSCRTGTCLKCLG